MQNIDQINLEFEQTLFLLRNSLVKAKNLLIYSGENQESFDKILERILQSEKVSDNLKQKLFFELDTISNLIKRLFELDKNNAEKEIGRFLEDVLKLKRDDSKKVLKGVLEIVGDNR